MLFFEEIDLSAQTTIFVGKNAAGKTNTVEALQLLTAGYSFRKPTPSQLLLTGTSEAKIEISLTGDGRKLEKYLHHYRTPSSIFKEWQRKMVRLQIFLEH